MCHTSGVGAARWSQMTPVAALGLVDVPWVYFHETIVQVFEDAKSTAPPTRLSTGLSSVSSSRSWGGGSRRWRPGRWRSRFTGVAAANPAAFDPGLAGALTKLGLYLSEPGRQEPALAAGEEAVEIYRRLAASNVAAFEADLARALWASAWVRLRRSELAEALIAAREAIETSKSSSCDSRPRLQQRPASGAMHASRCAGGAGPPGRG